MKSGRTVLIIASAAAGAALHAQTPETNGVPDPSGTGPYPAIKETVASLPDHVIYRPKDPGKLGGRKLAILGWGNGACAPDGASSRFQLLEIASHGYVVIAPGGVHSGPGSTPWKRQPLPDGKMGPVETTTADVVAGIDWAIAENSRPGSPLEGHVDTDKIAVDGFSCGGIQAIEAASAPRVKATIVQNSGVFPDDGPGIPGVDVHKDALERFHTPVLYVLGGETDIAHPNGTDDVARIDHVPVFLADLKGAGHGGTYEKPNGGIAAQVVVDWLEWQLFGDRKAAATFVGDDCRLCTDSRWDIVRKGFGDPAP